MKSFKRLNKMPVGKEIEAHEMSAIKGGEDLGFIKEFRFWTDPDDTHEEEDRFSWDGGCTWFHLDDSPCKHKL